MQNAAIIGLAIVDIILVALSQIALWQRKEYRADRMREYIDSPEGSLKQHPWPLIAGLLVGMGWMLVLRENEVAAEYAGLASLLLILVGHTVRIRIKGVMRPTLTFRAGIVSLVVCIACIAWGIYLVIPHILVALQMATLAFFLPVIIAGVVFLVTIPATLQKKWVISQAKKLRNSFDTLTVVGITGSVGKTSTKTYLLHILGGASKTVQATSEHRNSPYVVALDMLSKLTSKTSTYIAEMGAYKKGEIAELCQLAQPKIGVLTAITNQHAALFGSLENLATAKWELIDALPTDGIAVLNADDKNVVKKAKGLKKKVVWYSLKEKNPILTHASVIGNGQLSSVFAAVTVARTLGVSDDVIAKRLATLPVLSQTMELKKGKNSSTVIDDSYSASEASVMNAIEYLRELSVGDNRLVMVPIIELGSEGPAVHKRIGKALSPLPIQVYIYGDAYREDIQKGLGVSPAAIVVWMNDPKVTAQQIAKDMATETVVVLEGRLPNIIRQAVIPDLIGDPSKEVDSRLRGNDKRL
ncbi:MAG: hypothetical protein A3C02_00120 [Candidatus Andersenbacteria bacterium RIFCSPHIGHO2_02_FULL_45_11]|uniref:Mur ligase central domain-containing protein n=1 Tax=Candidatus Andersenbacteria bacterium RIFCSPHIGHO2_12_FULL_45_11 TaxID=1797281 RepID=A0A1G1X2D2_9BACT|nr:MAG: hypothetical protein A2805_02085 [Candidatus Andersenbacteria bacterium RIFCSPHIGHO2_01_FULL_46_36]OGY31961.1 MAG: hypothetical protein A3C02_00120 [Candidatus Andersenbacteria bacterium RIFCSPHIGHO2_02_FULL_45_11]OGY34172.1 MAG: hypothetical protein A3D99_00440 [Candidatus Andersenbacteria bacterium RIFCSPHIGHO2_12_FULL_45_11]QBM02291.1 UDP-N-acetylmuramoyl-tripeptide--D-alanyl-D-alanine ligase [uncultured archaeon]